MLGVLAALEKVLPALVGHRVTKIDHEARLLNGAAIGAAALVDSLI